MGSRFHICRGIALWSFVALSAASANAGAPPDGSCQDPDFQPVFGILQKLQSQAVKAQKIEQESRYEDSLEAEYLKRRARFLESEAGQWIDPQMLEHERETDQKLTAREFISSLNLSAEDPDWIAVIRGGPEEIERALQADTREFARVQTALSQTTEALCAKARSSRFPSVWADLRRADAQRKQFRVKLQIRERILAYLNTLQPQIESRCHSYAQAKAEDAARAPSSVSERSEKGEDSALDDDDGRVVDGESLKKNLDFTRESHGLGGR